MADKVTYDPFFTELAQSAIQLVSDTNSPERDSGHALNFGVDLMNKLAQKLNPDDRVWLGEEMEKAIADYNRQNANKIANFHGSRRGATFQAAYTKWAKTYQPETTMIDDRPAEKPAVAAYDGFHEWTRSA